ncbi:nuclear transport factor 2 family protein [Nakamurella silvestris]|nr:nuclear transport factor 2 family protein [Nakamurella silvestris]
MSDLVVLSDLVVRYAHQVDHRRFADLGELFTADAELVLPDPPRNLEPVRRLAGRTEIVAAMGGLDGLVATRHALHGQVVEVGEDPDSAIGSVVGEAHHLLNRPDGVVQDCVWFLRYEDRYQRGDGRWRFARRRLTIDWIEYRDLGQVRGGPERTAHR